MPNTTETASTKLKIDCHVHVVGNGSSGNGCVMRLKGRHRPQAAIMLHQYGLAQRHLHGDLDGAYIDRLVTMLRGSSLDAAVILAHEWARDDAGKIIEGFGSLYVPNPYVLDLGKRFPELLPGISIHPARPDALEELERGLAGGAVLMKCLPNCQNFNPSDKRFTPFWERMAEAGLPLLAHTGGEFSLPVYEPRYCDPALLELPLSIGVKVIGAHCGTPSLYFDPDYTDTFARLLGKYPNLYGDNSGLLTPVRSRHFAKLLREPYLDRILHGSDIPIPISGLWSMMRRTIGIHDYSRARAEQNIFERDVQLKRAMGFPEASFTAASDILRISPEQRVALADKQRLRAKELERSA